ncbi:hypothetical protein MJA45_26850 [Paenibacillus aurantius]|uniref:Sin domain-containing protein n=1 Tax=Paenibacillus aurantius TaxID=2918900 RepID=A0AA96LGQ2_9BACL|nr:hypothetical protein [Paenibacillus aurantius]WNQ11177.1 hypothetical protein MJA45_26850 [Paenibacillus aurantius]
MYVASGAAGIVRQRRRSRFRTERVRELLEEAEKLGMTIDEVWEDIQREKRSGER